MYLEILRAGFLSSVQDLGRIGSRRYGVSVGGALDMHALRVANLLAGNEEASAGIEITFGGLQLRFADERTIAWCGGEFDSSAPAGRAVVMHAGERLIFGNAKLGCRSWLAVSGGIDVPPLIGSRSTDLRGGFGGWNGRQLRDADQLPVGPTPPVPLQTAKVSSWSAPVDWTMTGKHEPVLRVVRGNAWDRFQQPATLLRELFFVTSDSNRMGARLEGALLERNDDVDLVSEAVAPGTIQIPPSGKPILLLGDCQTVGGYPKIAHVITVDLPIAAQLRPGDQVRFREISLTEAHRLLFERERDFKYFKTGLSFRA